MEENKHSEEIDRVIDRLCHSIDTKYKQKITDIHNNKQNLNTTLYSLNKIFSSCPLNNNCVTDPVLLTYLKEINEIRKMLTFHELIYINKYAINPFDDTIRYAGLWEEYIQYVKFLQECLYNNDLITKYLSLPNKSESSQKDITELFERINDSTIFFVDDKDIYRMQQLAVDCKSILKEDDCLYIDYTLLTNFFVIKEYLSKYVPRGINSMTSGNHKLISNIKKRQSTLSDEDHNERAIELLSKIKTKNNRKYNFKLF